MNPFVVALNSWELDRLIAPRIQGGHELVISAFSGGFARHRISRWALAHGCDVSRSPEKPWANAQRLIHWTNCD